MSRELEETLRKCPTCGSPTVDDLGLRDYSTWLSDLLPGRVSGSDLDCVLEQHSTGRVLILEFKPDRYVPRGQRLLLDHFAALPLHEVYIVVDKAHPSLTVAKVVPDGLLSWHSMHLSEFKKFVRAWWDRDYEPDEASEFL